MRTRIALAIVAVGLLAFLWVGSRPVVITNTGGGGPPPYQSEAPFVRRQSVDKLDALPAASRSDACLRAVNGPLVGCRP